MSGPLDLPSAPLATEDQRSDPATDPRGRGLGAPRRSAIWWLPRARGPRGCTRSRSGDALVPVMEPADLGDGANPAAGRRLDVSGDGAVVLQRLMRTRTIVIGHVGAQETRQMSVIENEEMVEALSSNRADDPLCEGILPGRAGGGEDLANSHALGSPRELLAVDRVSITEQEPGNRIVRE